MDAIFRSRDVRPRDSKNPRNAWVFLLVAGVGFEPATFGL